MDTNDEQSVGQTHENGQSQGVAAVAAGSALQDTDRLDRLIDDQSLWEVAQRAVGINESFSRDHIDAAIHGADEKAERAYQSSRRNLMEMRADIDRKLLKLEMQRPARPNVQSSATPSWRFEIRNGPSPGVAL